MQQVKGSVINSMILGRNHFCCLCFKTVVDSAVHIEDKVVVKKHDNTYFEVYMIDILTDILGSEISDQLSIFNAVCNQCSSGAINSYKFYTKCKDYSQKLGQIIDGVTNGAEILCQTNSKGVKAGFVSINTENLEYRGYNSNITASTGSIAYHKFKYLQGKNKIINKPAVKTITNKPAVKTIPRITKLNRTNEELTVLRLRLVRLNPKVLNQQTVFVCPRCDQFFTRRYRMHLHYHRKHHSDSEYFVFDNSVHVIKTNESKSTTYTYSAAGRYN